MDIDDIDSDTKNDIKNDINNCEKIITIKKNI